MGPGPGPRASERSCQRSLRHFGVAPAFRPLLPAAASLQGRVQILVKSALSFDWLDVAPESRDVLGLVLVPQSDAPIRVNDDNVRHKVGRLQCLEQSLSTALIKPNSMIRKR